MNVLSLFDGMSCGRAALESAGFKVDKYFASEIDKYAMAVSAYNYPDIVQIGDVCKVDVKTLPKIDLILAGSPCQGFSLAGKQLNFNERGELMEIYKTARVLIIDDLGKGRLSPMSLSNIYDIVNYRNINALITIVSSNLSLDQISESFDSSVASRLFEMCDIVEMKGEDLRIKPVK